MLKRGPVRALLSLCVMVDEQLGFADVKVGGSSVVNPDSARGRIPLRYLNLKSMPARITLCSKLTD
jgi:hypothetical protein